MAEIFTHIHEGRARMVDISDKSESVRRAVASGHIRLKSATIEAIRSHTFEKGNVLATARIAAVQAVKRTWDTIPMCHQIPITHVDVEFDVKDDRVDTVVEVRSVGKTGVEMEALHGVSVALLTVWDMVKSAEKDETGNYPETVISDIMVDEKVKEKV
ncbi:MAG: cyclic pyranopterin monophosphate synthase MoaC [Methanosarcinales archaeon]|nr:cyclic pyranopterin monophosphate synthase MoaC [Methanosarcinales archaeon]